MRKIAFILAAMILACVSAWGAESVPPEPQSAETVPAGVNTAPSTTEPAATKIAAVVGGRPITVLDVTQWLKLAEVDPAKATPQDWQEALGAAINRAVLLNGAKDAKIEVTDDDAAKVVAERRASPDGAEYRKRVNILGLNSDEERQRMKEQLMVEKLLAARLGTKLFVTPKMAEEWYAKNGALLATPEKRTARVITLRDADRKAARTRLETLRKELVAGADFAETAKKVSADPWAAKGGLLPEVSIGSGSVFERQIFGLAKKGDVSDVFETDAGVHLVRLEEVTPAAVPPLQQVQERIRERLLDELRERYVPEVVGELRRRMVVQVFWENLGGGH